MFYDFYKKMKIFICLRNEKNR